MGAQNPDPLQRKAPWGGNYRFAAVTADNGLCSTVGTELLARQGASVVDAGIATLICLSAVNAQSAGVGGGVLMTIYERPNNGTEKELKSLIGRETSAQSAHKDMFEDNPGAQSAGVHSIMPMGEVNGWYEAWQRYGRVPWAELFRPTIAMCREGWRVSEHMEDGINNRLEDIKADPGLRAQYLKAGDVPYKAGDIMTDPLLADTLEMVAADPRGFYTGTLADLIIDDIKAVGGNLTKADLMSNSVLWDDVISATLKNGDYTLVGTAPPSSSIIVAFIMKLMDGYNVSPSDASGSPEERALFFHRLAESFKMGFARRVIFLGDPTHVDPSLMNEWMTKMADDSYVDSVRVQIQDDRVLEDYGPSAGGSASLNLPGGTTHLNVVGADGSFVGMTSTVGSFFGSAVRGQKTGIAFNNCYNLFDHRGTMASDPDNTVNHIAPGKRPRSSTGCVMILDKEGRPVFSVGGSGGPRIITGSAEVTTLSLWAGLNVTNAVDYPRVYTSHTTPTKLYHDPLPQEVLDSLRSKGHTDQEAIPSSTFGYLAVIQAVDTRQCVDPASTNQECIAAVSDIRKGNDSYPDGY